MLKTWKLNLKQFAALLPTRDLILWLVMAGLPFLLLIFAPSVWQPIEQQFLDLKTNIDQRFLHTDKSDELVILGIDSTTLTDAPCKWPWPGSYWAQLLKKIDENYQPKVILIDIFFQNDQQDPSNLELLAAELKRNGKTGLVGIFEESAGIAGNELKVFPPLKILRNNAAFWGISQQPLDADGTVRTFVLSDFRLNKNHVACEYLKHSSAFSLKNLPKLKKHSAFFRFKARQNSARILSLQGAIDGTIPPEQLRNKEIIIGPNDQILHDYHKTPVGVLTGPELVFNSIATLRSGNFQIQYQSLLLQFVFVGLGIIFALSCFNDYFKQNFVASIVVGLLYFLILLIGSFMVSIQLPVAASMLAFMFFAAINLLLFRFIKIARIRDSMHEAEICGRIQQKFFPAQALKTEYGIEIEGSCLPFQFAGGDYYDFFTLPDGKIFFILADVSGHGISAGMITTAAKSIVSIHGEKEEFSVTDLFHDINLAIRHMSDRRIMMSAVAGLIDRETGKIKLYSAGHLPGHLVINGAVEEFPIPGMPLGASKKTHRSGFVEFALPQNGQLVFYSDGVIEAVNWQNQMFGFDNFRALLAEKATDNARGTIENVFCALRKHCEGRSFQDDVTILVINFSNSLN